MKKGVVSLAAVLMVLASLATPSYAGKLSGGLNNSQTYVGENFTVTYAVGTGVAGGTLPASLTIRVNADETGAPRRMTGIAIQALELGQQRSTFVNLPVNKAKTLSKSFSIPSRVEPGTYNVVFSVQVGAELKNFSVPVTINR